MTAPRPLGIPPATAPDRARRWVELGPVLKAGFGERVAKLPLDGGYTCPNRDGTLADTGCVYCGEGSRGMIARAGAISRQYEAAVAHRKERAYIPYFQAYSSTYAPLDVLRRHWREALAMPGAVGLALSTRPDCLPPEVVRELAAMARDLPVWVEVGLESARDDTLRRIGRAHDAACFRDAVLRLTDAGLAVVAHLIFGLPQEPLEAGLDSVAYLQDLPLWGLKIHPFHVVGGSPLATLYHRGKLRLLERDDYVDLAARALTMCPPEWVIHRLTGSAPGDRHLAPDWAARPRHVTNDIRQTMADREWIQGCAVASSGGGDVPRRTSATTTEMHASAPAARNTPAPPAQS